MVAAIKSLVVVAIGFAAAALFIWSMMTGESATAPLHTLGAISALLLVWVYGFTQTY